MESKHIEILAKHSGYSVRRIKNQPTVIIAADRCLLAMAELTASHQAELKAKDEEIAKLKLQLPFSNKGVPKSYKDGFGEGYNMALEDIREGNPLNKVTKTFSKPKEEKK